MTTVTISGTALDEKTYKAGDFFLINGELSVLSQTGVFYFALIDINSGNRWKEGVNMPSSKLTGSQVRTLVDHMLIPVKSVKITYEV